MMTGLVMHMEDSRRADRRDVRLKAPRKAAGLQPEGCQEMRRARPEALELAALRAGASGHQEPEACQPGQSEMLEVIRLRTKWQEDRLGMVSLRAEPRDRQERPQAMHGPRAQLQMVCGPRAQLQMMQGPRVQPQMVCGHRELAEAGSPAVPAADGRRRR